MVLLESTRGRRDWRNLRDHRQRRKTVRDQSFDLSFPTTGSPMTSGPPSIIVMMPPAHHQQQAQASHNSSCERARSTNNTSGTPLRDANGNNNDILTVVASSSGTASPVDPSTPSRSLMAHQRGLHESSVPCINNNIDNHHYHIQDNVPDLLTRSSYRNSLPHSPSSTNSLVRRTSFSSTTSSRRSSSELAMNNQTTTASAEIPPMLPRKEKSLHHQQTHSQSSSLLSSTPSSFPSTHHPISSSSSATVENSSSSTSTTSINNINNNNNNQATLINVRNSTCITARVKAQVMTRDDSTWGWLPVSGGGLSNVMLIKRSLLDNTIKNATSTSSGKVNTSRSHHHHRHHHHRQTSSSSNHNMSSATNTNNHQSISPVNASSHSSTEMPSTNHYDDSNSNSSLLHEYLIVGTRISDKNVSINHTQVPLFIKGNRTDVTQQHYSHCSREGCSHSWISFSLLHQTLPLNCLPGYSNIFPFSLCVVFIVSYHETINTHDYDPLRRWSLNSLSFSPCLQIVLYCNMKRDFVYNKAMPTFHHWMTGNTKFGLTFVSASEARSFDHSITTAIKDLLLNDGKKIFYYFFFSLHSSSVSTPLSWSLLSLFLLDYFDVYMVCMSLGFFRWSFHDYGDVVIPLFSAFVLILMNSSSTFRSSLMSHPLSRLSELDLIECDCPIYFLDLMVDYSLSDLKSSHVSRCCPIFDS